MYSVISPTSCQMLSDITGRTVETVAHAQEVDAIGTALVVAAGLKGDDVFELSKRLVKVTHAYVPDPTKKEIYHRNYGIFKKLYKSNAAYFKQLNA